MEQKKITRNQLIHVLGAATTDVLYFMAEDAAALQPKRFEKLTQEEGVCMMLKNMIWGSFKLMNAGWFEEMAKCGHENLGVEDLYHARLDRQITEDIQKIFDDVMKEDS